MLAAFFVYFFLQLQVTLSLTHTEDLFLSFFLSLSFSRFYSQILSLSHTHMCQVNIYFPKYEKCSSFSSFTKKHFGSILSLVWKELKLIWRELKLTWRELKLIRRELKLI